LILEMGLGKTVSVLSAIEHLQRERGYGPALILAPLRVVYSVYPDEVAKWEQLSGMSLHIIHGKGRQWPLPQADLYISNFETIPWLHKNNIEKVCGVLVIDESTAIKNPGTVRFKTLKKFAGKFEKRICMTGTPDPSGKLLDVWGQVYLLDGGKRLGKSFYQYKQKYYDKDFMGYNLDLKAGAREVIQDKIKDIQLTMQAADYLEMPDKIETLVPFDLPPAVMKQYKEMEKEYIVFLQTSDEPITAPNAAAMSGKLRQIVAGAMYNEEHEPQVLHCGRIDALEEVTAGVSGNLLIGYQFKFEKIALLERFPGAKFIDGDTSPSESRSIVTKWNAGEIKLLCCHPASAGHGLNLQAGGNVLIWLSRDWSMERTQQFEARIFRQGQKKKVFIYSIVARGTIDYEIAARLVEKGSGQRQLIDILKQYNPSA